MTARDQIQDAQHDIARSILETLRITKDYPGVRALDAVDFDLKAGEVHVLFGENGAGKSTLISLIAGANTPSAGEIRVNGEPARLASVHEARDLGISAVFQEFSLIPQMTVEENLFLGAEPTAGRFLNKKELRAKAQQILDDLNFHISPRARVDHLTRAEQQMVEIAKAFRADLSILILDEPTASLTHHETEQLFGLIAKLKEQGVGIIYITHRMAEIREIGDRITVLRDGRYIDTVDAKTTSEDELVRLMTGRVIGEVFPDFTSSPGDVLLRIEDVFTGDGSVRGASIEVRAGEIVALAGLVGSGKSELAQAAFGATDVASGRVELKGRDITGASTRSILDDGFLYLPADRRVEGLMMMRSARENIGLASLRQRPISRGLYLDRKAEAESARHLAERLNLSPMRIERSADHFSGGNQQKIMLARCLAGAYDLIALDEPTVGVDVGTRAAIYEFIVELCRQGAGILLISSDMPEVLHLSNRVYVFYRGRIQAELQGDDITEENVLKHFFEREAA